MRVGDLLSSKRADVVTIAPDETVESAVRLLVRHDIGGLPVAASDGGLIGFVAERDIAKAVGMNVGAIQHLPVKRVMRTPAPICAADDPLRDVMGRMTRERLRHIVVMEGPRIAGIVSVGDIVKHRLEQLEIEAGVLRDYVTAHRALS